MASPYGDSYNPGAIKMNSYYKRYSNDDPNDPNNPKNKKKLDPSSFSDAMKRRYARLDQYSYGG